METADLGSGCRASAGMASLFELAGKPSPGCIPNWSLFGDPACLHSIGMGGILFVAILCGVPFSLEPLSIRPVYHGPEQFRSGGPAFTLVDVHPVRHSRIHYAIDGGVDPAGRIDGTNPAGGICLFRFRLGADGDPVCGWSISPDRPDLTRQMEDAERSADQD